MPQAMGKKKTTDRGTESLTERGGSKWKIAKSWKGKRQSLTPPRGEWQTTSGRSACSRQQFPYRYDRRWV